MIVTVSVSMTMTANMSNYCTGDCVTCDMYVVPASGRAAGG